jgi:hypothetical protein
MQEENHIKDNKEKTVNIFYKVNSGNLFSIGFDQKLKEKQTLKDNITSSPSKNILNSSNKSQSLFTTKRSFNIPNLKKGINITTNGNSLLKKGQNSESFAIECDSPSIELPVKVHSSQITPRQDRIPVISKGLSSFSGIKRNISTSVIEDSNLKDHLPRPSKSGNNISSIFNNKEQTKHKMENKPSNNNKVSSLTNDYGITHQIYNAPIKRYEEAKYGMSSNGVICSYGANTNQGLIRNYNEDRVSIILNVIKPNSRANEEWPKVSYFAIYDGHGGNRCADFLKDNLHQYVCK